MKLSLATVRALGALLLWVGQVLPAQAAVNCTASMTAVSFGAVDLVAGTGLQTNATLNYSCTNTSLMNVEYVRVCFHIGEGAQGGGFFNPQRRMLGGGNPLWFQLYDSSGSVIWGTRWQASLPPYQATLTVPRRSGGVNGQAGGSAVMQGRIQAGQAAVPAGSYQNDFSGGHTEITWTRSTASMPGNCTGALNGGTFPFLVSATVVKGCQITAGAASDINLGAVPYGSSNLAANNNIHVTCSGGTPYHVGLRPSNGHSAGAGVMSGSGGNTDQVRYQLRQAPGPAGAVWGNTATAAVLGNGVAGTGNGLPRSIPVYVTVPSTSYAPDQYSDTVTVTVHY